LVAAGVYCAALLRPNGGIMVFGPDMLGHLTVSFTGFYAGRRDGATDCAHLAQLTPLYLRISSHLRRRAMQ